MRFFLSKSQNYERGNSFDWVITYVVDCEFIHLLLLLILYITSRIHLNPSIHKTTSKIPKVSQLLHPQIIGKVVPLSSLTIKPVDSSVYITRSIISLECWISNYSRCVSLRDFEVNYFVSSWLRSVVNWNYFVKKWCAT